MKNVNSSLFFNIRQLAGVLFLFGLLGMLVFKDVLFILGWLKCNFGAAMAQLLSERAP